MDYALSQATVNARALRAFGRVHQVDGVDVRGDFTRPGKVYTVGDGMQVAATVPTLVIADADVPADPVGKTAVCDGDSFVIAERRPDGCGLTVLELEAV